MPAGTAPKLLFIAANAADTDRLRIDVEFREVQEGLLRARSGLQLEQRFATRASDLRRALLETQPEFLHISAHTGENGLLLEDSLRLSKPVGTEALANLFSLFASDLRCVVLNACYSAEQAKAIAAHIEYVVGMTSSISDKAAICFSVAFYDALAAEKNVQFAYQVGRNAIALEGLGESDQVVLFQNATSPAPHCDWSHAPEVPVLYGRAEELNLLDRWVHSDKVRLLLILGFGGVGKTGLSIRFGRGGIGKTDLALRYARQTQATFDAVIWRSLLSSPSPGELLADILAAIGRATDSTVEQPPTLEELVEQLRAKRVLLILDNFESVLDTAASSGTYRAGYELYGEILDALGRQEHQSCVLLTSREKPPEIENLEGQSRPVRTLLLRGLDVYNGRKIFDEIGSFRASDDEWRQLVDFYDGNPLALELAAHHIVSVFDGLVGAFLAQSSPLVADIESLLDWHISRLSESELEVLYWLAIDREPVSIDELKGDLLSREASRTLTTTIQSLQRHLPLEKDRLQIGLQPVMLEFLTQRFVAMIGNELQLRPLWTSGVVAGRLASKVGGELVGNRGPRLLRHFALCKATSKSSVRQSQRRLILVPIIDLLRASIPSDTDLRDLLLSILEHLRRAPLDNSYAAGNVISLLVTLAPDLSGFDLSHLTIRQVDFQEVELRGTNLRNSSLMQVRFRGGFAHLLCTAISPDGRALAAGDTQGLVHLWTLRDLEPVGVLEGHRGWVRCIAFSEDGEFLATGSEDRSVRVWSINDCFCEAVLKGHSHWVNDVVFDKSGKHVLSGSEDGTIRIWDWRASRSVQTLEASGVRIRALRLIGDQQMITAGSDGRALKWNLARGVYEAVLAGHTDWLAALDISEIASLVATGSFDCSARVWSLESDECLREFVGHRNWVWDVALSPDGQLLATASRDRSICIWSVETGECLRKIESAHEGTVRALAFFPNNDRLVSVGQDQTLRFWEVHDAAEVGVLRGYSAAIWSIEPGRTSSEILSGGDDAAVRVWDLRSGNCKAVMRGHEGRIWSVTSSGALAASGSSDRTARIWDIERRVEVQRIRAHDDWVLSVALSPNSDLLATGSSNWDPYVKLWEARTGHLIRSFAGHHDRIHGLAFSADGKEVISASDDSTVRLWSVEQGTELACVKTGFRGIRAKRSPFAVCRKRSLVAFAGAEGIVIWNWKVKSEEHRIVPVGGDPLAVSFDHCNEYVYVTNSTGSIEKWELGAGVPAVILQSVRPAYQDVCPLADGSRVCGATAGGAIDVWKVASQQLLNTLLAPRPYEGLIIEGTAGLTRGQRSVLINLGAVQNSV